VARQLDRVATQAAPSVTPRAVFVGPGGATRRSAARATALTTPRRTPSGWRDPCPGLRPGRDGLKQAFQIFWEATPGYHRIDDQLAEGDKVVTRLTAIGKHEGDLPGAPRTGNALQMTAITIHRIADGKLVEKWSEKDVLGFLSQIGVMPMPEHSGVTSDAGEL
jgi:predicted ester cyclase